MGGISTFLVFVLCGYGVLGDLLGLPGLDEV